MNSAIVKRVNLSLLILALAALVVAAPGVRAQDEEDDFQPRSSAPPGNRTGGASRSGSAGEQPPPTVSLLAPAKSVGLTTREQPVIYWYISADTQHPVAISVTDPGTEKETTEATIKGPLKAGVHRFDFASFKQDGKPVALKPGVKYEIVVEVLARKGTGGSENPSATCRIMRLDPKEAAALASAGKEQDPAKRASAYGKEGVWFDYIDALNAAIEKTPDDEALLQRRAKALAAQGLMWKPDGTISEKSGRPAGAPKQ
jgi:hypothetical protein